jgi:O-antigen/teichoic acid export membrane protein
MEWMYEGKYLHDAGWFLWLGLVPVLTAMVVVMSSVLKAIENPKSVAQIYFIMSIFTIIVVIPLSLIYSLIGSIITILISNSLTTILFYKYFKK